MVDYDYTSHEYRNGKKRFVPKSDYVKFHDGYWYPVRMTTYLYWFKFLQEAELSSEFEVDWKKYKDWGSKEEIIKDYVERVDVTYDRKNSLHILTIKFKYNIVRDNTFTHDETVEMGVKKIEGKNTTRLLIKKKERIKFRDLENANFN